MLSAKFLSPPRAATVPVNYFRRGSFSFRHPTVVDQITLQSRGLFCLPVSSDLWENAVSDKRAIEGFRANRMLSGGMVQWQESIEPSEAGFDFTPSFHLFGSCLVSGCLSL